MTIQIAVDDGDFFGLPCDSVKASNAGAEVSEHIQKLAEAQMRFLSNQPKIEHLPGETVKYRDAFPKDYKLNSTGTAAVATDYYWIPIDGSTPRGVKLQLLGQGGVAQYASYHGDRFWSHWAPLPKRKAE
jgi:hypothetical protein